MAEGAEAGEAGHGRREGGDKREAATCKAIPIDFEFQARAEGKGTRDGWRLVLGSGTSGTCFRSAAPSALRRRQEHWWVLV